MQLRPVDRGVVRRPTDCRASEPRLQVGRPSDGANQRRQWGRPEARGASSEELRVAACNPARPRSSRSLRDAPTRLDAQLRAQAVGIGARGLPDSTLRHHGAAVWRNDGRRISTFRTAASPRARLGRSTATRALRLGTRVLAGRCRGRTAVLGRSGCASCKAQRRTRQHCAQDGGHLDHGCAPVESCASSMCENITLPLTGTSAT
jgi:hypothetical protein